MNFTFDLTISLGLIVTLALALLSWVKHQLNDVRKGFEDARSSRGDLDRRLTVVENTVASLPGQRDVHGLQLTMANIAGELREMRAVMAGNAQIMGRLETIVTRHEDHLLQGGK